jgi:hypothetical protein
MKYTLVILLFAAFAIPAFGQDTTSCTELDKLQTTICTFADGTGESIDHADNHYDSRTYHNAQEWAAERKTLMQEEVVLETPSANQGRGYSLPSELPTARTDAPQMPTLDPSGIHNKKTCTAQGFDWKHGACSVKVSK